MHAAWRLLQMARTQFFRHSTQVENNLISEPRFSGAFAYALARMIVVQYRVVQSAWRSEAIAPLGDSKFVDFAFVGPVGP
jgi:hypothetical protein